MKETNRVELLQFSSRPHWYSIRGWMMIVFGAVIAFLCITSPEVYILSANFSWVPVVAISVILVGALRCLDAFSTVSAQGFLVNMQGGILDIVVGFLVLFGINGQPENMSLLIVGYLLSQGIYRNVILTVAKIPNPLSNRITGVISIIFALLIWFNWPTSSPWFLALALSADIGFRGWALIVLASSIKNKVDD